MASVSSADPFSTTRISKLVAAGAQAFLDLPDRSLQIAGFVVRGHDDGQHRLSSGEPGIGERQRAVGARYVGGVRSRCDDDGLRARCGERAVRCYCDGGTVSRDPERVRWPLRPRLVARERERQSRSIADWSSTTARSMSSPGRPSSSWMTAG